MPTVDEMYPSDWLKGDDLLDGSGNPLRVTIQIDHVIAEKGTDYRTRAEIDKWNLYFVGKQKKLTLNRTNANRLAEMFGDNSDLWHNQWIVIYPTLKNIGGKDIWVIDIHNRPGAAPAAGPGVAPAAAAPVAAVPSTAPVAAPVAPTTGGSDLPAGMSISDIPFG